MPRTTPELPVSYCQRPCPPLRNPKESSYVHVNASVLATLPTMRPGAVISQMHDVEHETCPMPKEAILTRAWRPTLAPHTPKIPMRNDESANLQMRETDSGHDQNCSHAGIARSGQEPTIYEPKLATRFVRPCPVDNCPRSLVRQRYVYFGSPSLPRLVDRCDGSAWPLVEIGLPPESNSTCVDSTSVTLPACPAGPLDETKSLHEFPRCLDRRCTPSFLLLRLCLLTHVQQYAVLFGWTSGYSSIVILQLSLRFHAR